MKTTSDQVSAPNPSTPEATRTVAEVLRKALEAFGPNGENWVRGTGGDAPKCCAVTSFGRIGMSAFYGTGEMAYEVLCHVVGAESGNLSTWNDSHTWLEVKAGYQAAIQEAGSQ